MGSGRNTPNMGRAFTSEPIERTLGSGNVVYDMVMVCYTAQMAAGTTESEGMMYVMVMVRQSVPQSKLSIVVVEHRVSPMAVE